LVAAACGGRPDLSAAAASAARPTPGVCGAWGTVSTDSLAACQKRLRDGAPDLRPGICGYDEAHGIDSVAVCLAVVDSAARLCSARGGWQLRQADAVVRRAEWRRCGPAQPERQGDQIVWPVDYVLLRADSSQQAELIWAESNATEPGVSGVSRIQGLDLDGDGTTELFMEWSIYGTGGIFDTCVLTLLRDRLGCWTGPDFLGADVARHTGEQLRKGWIRRGGAPVPIEAPGSPDSLTEGRSLWYFTPLYREGDPNCCGSVGASLWLEARPRRGRFETGFVLRVTEDSLGNAAAFDTVRRPVP
jgi:hypothetical protein